VNLKILKYGQLQAYKKYIVWNYVKKYEQELKSNKQKQNITEHAELILSQHINLDRNTNMKGLHTTKIGLYISLHT
jgi:adenylosuccinate synthase